MVRWNKLSDSNKTENKKSVNDYFSKDAINNYYEFTKKILYDMFDEIVRGPGAKKLVSVLLSPVGMLGSFFVLIAIILPLLPLTQSLVNTLWYIFFYIAISESWNIMGGYGGEVDFGHILFVGIGVYTVGILYMFHGFNIWIGIILGGIVSAISAILIGIPALRLRGAYFAITMLAFNEALAIIFINARSFTNGSNGLIVGSLLAKYPSLRLTTYYLIIFMSIIAYLITHYVSYTRLGLSLRAIRDSPDGAASVGINVMKTKMTAFVLSAFIAGLTGGVFLLRLLSLTPAETFNTSFTVEMIVITLLGGSGSVFGPVIGAIIIVPLKVILISALAQRSFTIFGATFKLDTAYLLIYGLIFIFAILFIPDGIIGYLEKKGLIKRESLVPEEEE